MCADTGCVTPHEIHLQLGEPFWRDRNFGEFSESGSDSVHDFAIARDPVYVHVRSQHSRTRIV
jgi:hypothetical protein